MVKQVKIIAVFSAVLVLSSCNVDSLFEDYYYDWYESGSGYEKDEEEELTGLKDFMVGHMVHIDGREGKELSRWCDSLTFASVMDSTDLDFGDLSIDWDDKKSYEYNRLDYTGDNIDFRVRLLPEGSSIKRLWVVSSDPELLKVSKGEDYYSFILEPSGVGRVVVTVGINDGSTTIEKKYIVHLMATLGINIYIDEFWTNPSLSKIRYKCTELPPNVESLFVRIRDSLAVDAECAWMDVRNGIYDYRTEEITYTMPMDTIVRLFQRDDRFFRYLVRDFYDALDYFSTQYVYGSDFVEDGDEIADVKYEYYPVRVRLFIDFLFDNPYLDYGLTIKSSERVDSNDEIEDSEDDGAGSDAEAVEHLQLILE